MPTAIPIEISNAVARAFPIRQVTTIFVVLDRWIPERAMDGCTFCLRREIVIARADLGQGRISWLTGGKTAGEFHALCAPCVLKAAECHKLDASAVPRDPPSPIEPAMVLSEVARALREAYGDGGERWIERVNEAASAPSSPVTLLPPGPCLFCKQIDARAGKDDRGLCSSCAKFVVERVSAG